MFRVTKIMGRPRTGLAFPPSPRPRDYRRWLLVAIVILACAVPPALEAAAGSRYRTRTRRIARGLTLTKMYDRKAPNRIRVLRADLSTKLTLDVALGTDILPERERTSSIAQRRGAIAAVNATTGTHWGRPLGLFAEDGDLKTSAIAPGAAFAVARNERSSYFGWPKLAIRATNLSTGEVLKIGDWNDESPDPDGIGGYTSAGPDYLEPPPNSCSARLVPTTEISWNPGRTGVGREYAVDHVHCGTDRMTLNGGIVLAAPIGSTGAKSIKSLPVGQDMRVDWATGWAGVVDVVAGNPLLVRDGVVVATPCDGYVCRRHPRTGVGVTAKGKLLLVTVDGRQERSVGLRIRPFARLMKRLGAVTAINLDGGGSTTMVVKGNLVNIPSDGSERKVTSALVILPRRDAEEPRPLQP